MLNAREAAAVLQVDRATVDRLARSGRLAYEVDGRGWRWYREQDIRDLLDQMVEEPARVTVMTLLDHMENRAGPGAHGVHVRGVDLEDTEEL